MAESPRSRFQSRSTGDALIISAEDLGRCSRGSVLHRLSVCRSGRESISQALTPRDVPCPGSADHDRPAATRRSVKPFLYCLALLVAAAFLVVGCRVTADAPASIAGGDLPSDQRPHPVPVVFGATADRQTDPFDLDAAEVSDDILSIEVSYAGGCRNHVFVLTAATSFRRSDPVQLPMVLTHDDNDDPCEAYPTENRRFNLTPIKERYRAVYGRDSGSVRLLLHPAPDSAQPLVYEF